MQFATVNDQHLQALRLAALIETGKDKLVQFEERILCAAITLPSEGVVMLPSPARHHEILMVLARAGIPGSVYHQSTQGFFTSMGRFVDREMAMRIARRAQQVISDTQNIRLFSEDVW